jgi:hypothetical protein
VPSVFLKFSDTYLYVDTIVRKTDKYAENRRILTRNIPFLFSSFGESSKRVYAQR